LLEGNITFPLPNASEISEIKKGKYSYEEIIEMATRLDQEFELWYQESKLPHSPDKKGLTNLYLRVIMETK
jgi:uncharacterized protein